MGIINFRKNKLLIVVCVLIFIVGILIISNSFGMQHYYNVDFSTAIVTANKLNVRSGPGTGYNVIKQVNKDEYIRVFAGVGSWYIVQVEGDFVGAVNKNYVKPIYSNMNIQNSTNNNNNNNISSNLDLTQDELETFNLVNQERVNNGLNPLKIDNEVQRVARIKAQDMVDRSYFSHTSPTYGSPFDMLKSFKVSYKSAGENLAGNSSNSAAVTAWMNSPGHKANILNSSYNYTGMAVVSSPVYGKIYVQMFIGK